MQYLLKNLVTLYEEVSCNLERGRPAGMVYLDFTKEFDTVSHKRLIYKLRSVGINDCVSCN